MAKECHGQGDPWPRWPMAKVAHGQGGPWPMAKVAHGQGGPWPRGPMAKVAHGQGVPKPRGPKAKGSHGQGGPMAYWPPPRNFTKGSILMYTNLEFGKKRHLLKSNCKHLMFVQDFSPKTVFFRGDDFKDKGFL